MRGQNIDIKAMTGLKEALGNKITVDDIFQLQKEKINLGGAASLAQNFKGNLTLHDIRQLQKIGFNLKLAAYAKSRLHSATLPELIRLYKRGADFEKLKATPKYPFSQDEIDPYKLPHLVEKWERWASHEEIKRLEHEDIDLVQVIKLKKVWGDSLKIPDIIELGKGGVLPILLGKRPGEKIIGEARTIGELLDLYRKDPGQFTFEKTRHNLAQLVEFQNPLDQLRKIRKTQDFTCFIVSGVNDDPRNVYKDIRENFIWGDSSQIHSVRSNGKECVVFPNYSNMMKFIAQAENEQILAPGEKLVILQNAHGLNDLITCDDSTVYISEMQESISSLLNKYKVGLLATTCFSGTHLLKYMNSFSKKQRDSFCMFAASIAGQSAWASDDIREEMIARFYLDISSGESLSKFRTYSHMSSDLPFNTFGLNERSLESKDNTARIQSFKKEVEETFPKSCHTSETGMCNTCKNSQGQMNDLFRSIYSVMSHLPEYSDFLTKEDQDSYQACENFKLHFQVEDR